MSRPKNTQKIGIKCPRCQCEEFNSKGLQWRCNECGRRLNKSKVDKLLCRTDDGIYNNISQLIGGQVEPIQLSFDECDIKLGDYGITKSIEDIKSDEKLIECKSKNKPLSLEELMDEFNVDGELWKPYNFKINAWDVTNKSGETFTNYQSKVTLKRDEKVFKEQIIVDSLIEQIKSKGTLIPKLKMKSKPSNNKHLLINLFDLHLDKLADFSCSLTESNLETAIAKFISVVTKISCKALSINSHYETIIFPIGNDLFNADTLINTTVKGTNQHVDGKWDTVFKKVSHLMSEIIIYLSAFCNNVYIPIVCGNHDTTKTFYIGQVLKARFHDNSNIVINDSRYPLSTYKLGQTLLAFTHGDTLSTESIPMVLAQNFKEEWCNTKYKEVFCGHFHHKKNYKFNTSYDTHGVCVRYLRTICTADEWHTSKGFDTAVRGTESFIIDDIEGIEYIIDTKI